MFKRGNDQDDNNRKSKRIQGQKVIKNEEEPEKNDNNHDNLQTCLDVISMIQHASNEECKEEILNDQPLNSDKIEDQAFLYDLNSLDERTQQLGRYLKIVMRGHPSSDSSKPPEFFNYKNFNDPIYGIEFYPQNVRPQDCHPSLSHPNADQSKRREAFIDWNIRIYSEYENLLNKKNLAKITPKEIREFREHVARAWKLLQEGIA